MWPGAKSAQNTERPAKPAAPKETPLGKKQWEDGAAELCPEHPGQTTTSNGRTARTKRAQWQPKAGPPQKKQLTYHRIISTTGHSQLAREGRREITVKAGEHDEPALSWRSLVVTTGQPKTCPATTATKLSRRTTAAALALGQDGRTTTQAICPTAPSTAAALSDFPNLL